MIISPTMHSLASLTKKSAFGAPIPIAIILTGTPLYKPVMVRNPRSDSNTKGGGLADRNFAILLALE